MQRIILIGGGPHAEVVADIVEQEGRYELAGITDTGRAVGDRFLDYEVIGRQDQLAELIRSHQLTGYIVTVGDNYGRAKVIEQLREQLPEFELVSAVHPSVVVGRDAQIGPGTVIMAGCVVSVGARIGCACILNTASVLEHHGVMDDYSSMANGVITGGVFRLGRYSALAPGVTTMDRISVGENVVVGAGSLVTKDTEDNVLMYGSPARVIRKREPGERFLK